MDGFTVDNSELDRLAADLDAAADGIEPFLVKALKVTSLNIKKGSARKVGRRRHFRQAAQAINFDIVKFQGFGASVVQSEIGYDKERPAGALGNLVEFGAPGSPNALTPGSELVSTLHENEADFERGVTAALDDVLKKQGL